MPHLKMLPANYSLTNHIYLINTHVYKEDLASSNPQELMYHKTQPTNKF